ncbi:MAG: hypothetical protein HY074_02915 [Deltaproteobacteria bacterium]|nr:hypothetical protein [Deltaproteobacteria bacterium]
MSMGKLWFCVAAVLMLATNSRATSERDRDGWTDPVTVHWEIEPPGPRPGVVVEHSRWVWKGANNTLMPALRTELVVKLPGDWSYVGSHGGDAQVMKTDSRGTRLLVEQTHIAATVNLEYRAGEKKIPLTLELIAPWRMPALVGSRDCAHYRLRIEPTRPQGRHLFLAYTCIEDNDGAEFYFARSSEASWRTRRASQPKAPFFRARVQRPPPSQGKEDDLLQFETGDQDGDVTKFAVDFTGERPGAHEWLEVQPRLFIDSESVTDRVTGSPKFRASALGQGLNLAFGRSWDSRWKLMMLGEFEHVSFPSPFAGHVLSQPSSVMSKTGLGFGRDFNDRVSASFDLGFAQEMFFVPQPGGLLTADETGLARARLKASYDWIIRNNLASALEVSGGYYFPKEMVGYTINSSWQYGVKLIYRATGAPRASRTWFDGDFFFSQVSKNTTVSQQLSTEYGLELRFSFACSYAAGRCCPRFARWFWETACHARRWPCP